MKCELLLCLHAAYILEILPMSEPGSKRENSLFCSVCINVQLLLSGGGIACNSRHNVASTLSYAV